MPTSRREFRTQNRSCPQGPMWASAPTQITKRSRKQKCLHRGVEDAAPYKGARSRPRPVGDGVVSAAVGGFAALRLRHTPCGCDVPPLAPQRAVRYGLQQNQSCQHGRSMSAPTAETEEFTFYRMLLPILRPSLLPHFPHPTAKNGCPVRHGRITKFLCRIRCSL